MNKFWSNNELWYETELYFIFKGNTTRLPVVIAKDKIDSMVIQKDEKHLGHYCLVITTGVNEYDLYLGDSLTEVSNNFYKMLKIKKSE